MRCRTGEISCGVGRESEQLPAAGDGRFDEYDNRLKAAMIQMLERELFVGWEDGVEGIRVKGGDGRMRTRTGNKLC